MREIGSFILRGAGGTEISVFTAYQPRQAAIKAANHIGGTRDKLVKIRLHECCTKKVHIFKGWKEIIAASKYRPGWMPDKIDKPFIKKIGTEKIE